MTVHLIEPPEAPKPHRHKRKIVEVIATLKANQAVSASEIADACEMHPSNVSTTLDLLLEYELVRYAGKGPQSKNGGHRPALWEWV